MASMSLVVPKQALGFPYSELGDDQWQPLSFSLVAVLISIIFLRGSFSFLFDFVRVLRRMVSTQHNNKGVQTEPYYPQLPSEVYVNPRSETFHTEGCHYIGVRGQAISVCTHCKNKW